MEQSIIKLAKAQNSEIFNMLENNDLQKYKQLKTFDDYRLFIRALKKERFATAWEIAEKIGELTGYTELTQS